MLLKIFIGMALGIVIGIYGPEWLNRAVYTVSSIFGEYLSFILPLIILTFISIGIANISKGAGKVLLVTVLISYVSTLIAGTAAVYTSGMLFPRFVNPADFSSVNTQTVSIKPYFELNITPPLSTMSALLLSFIIGMGLSVSKAKAKNSVFYRFMDEFYGFILKAVYKTIIPFLPVYICGTFAGIAYSGIIVNLLQVLWKVLLVVIVLQLIYLLLQYLIAGAICRKNPFRLLRQQLPAYLTALGTQSSAATVPINLECAERQGIPYEIRSFTVPLCANIHLCGSMISICCSVIAALLIQGSATSPSRLVLLMLILGIAMIAAPGVPGGAIITALSFLTIVGIEDRSILSILVAIYIIQDSFGTACNVSGDNAIAQIITLIQRKIADKESVPSAADEQECSCRPDDNQPA